MAKDDRDLGTRGEEHKAEGGLRELGGKIQEGIGKLTGDKETELKGKGKQLHGKAEQGLGKAESGIDRAKEELKGDDSTI